MVIAKEARDRDVGADEGMGLVAGVEPIEAPVHLSLPHAGEQLAKLLNVWVLDWGSSRVGTCIPATQVKLRNGGKAAGVVWKPG
jgi:hypothetical protein